MIRTANIEISLQRLNILRLEHPQANPLRLVCTLRAGESLPSGLEVTFEIHTSRNVPAETAPLASSVVTVAADATSFEVLFTSEQLNQTVTPDGTRALWLVGYGAAPADQLYTLASADLLLGWHAISRLTAAPPNVTLFVEKGGVAWVSGRNYQSGTMVTAGTTAYVATAGHTSGASTEPGEGVDWETVWVVISGDGGGATNLGATVSPTQVVITSDTGDDATIPAADGTNAGVMLPAQVTKLAGLDNKTVYLFCLSGQSNAYGFGGDAALAPTPSARTFQWTSAGGVEALENEPGASGGEALGKSCAAAFANMYTATTGRNVGIVAGVMVGGAAQAAAAQLSEASGNFDTTGAHRAVVVSRYLAAKSAFEAAGYTVIMAGILWVQGEQDASAIGSGTITQATYQSALTTMLAYYRSNINANLPVYIIRTGSMVGSTDVGPAAVRAAQENVAFADPKTHIAYRDADTFEFRSMMSDSVHYNQAGMNEMGQRAALFCCGIQQDEPVSLKGSSTLVRVTSDNQVVQTHSGYIRLSSDSPTASSRSIVLTPPLRTGQVIFIENASLTNFVQLLNGQANASGSGTCWLKSDWTATAAKDNITLISDGVNWIELSRRDPDSLSSGSSVGSLTIGTPSAAMSSATGTGPIGAAIGIAGEVMVFGENTGPSGPTKGSLILLHQNDGAACASGDRLGGLLLGGAVSSSVLRNVATMEAFATENYVSGTNQGSAWSVATTENGTAIRASKLWVNHNGNIGVGYNSGAAVFSVSVQPTARLQIRGAGTTTGVTLLVENSSGTARFTVRDDGAFAFAGGTVAVAETGWTTFSNLTALRTCDVNTVTLQELARIVGTMIQADKAKGLKSA
jgi:hypothetical protein